VQYSVRDFVIAAAEEIELPLTWQGSGPNESAVDSKGVTRVCVDPRYFRPTEVQSLVGDASRAHVRLGWKPKTTFKDLVAEMAREDLKSAERDALVKRHGYRVLDQHE